MLLFHVCCVPFGETQLKMCTHLINKPNRGLNIANVHNMHDMNQQSLSN